MGPSPLQILLVIAIALLLFGAGRLADLREASQRKRNRQHPAAARGVPAPPRSDPSPPPAESEPT
jgi:hypothetical protein